MRKYKILFILLLIILANGWSHAQTIAMRIPDTTVIAGNTIDIPVYADSSLTAKNILSYLFQFTYNQSYLQLQSVIVTGTLSASLGSPTLNTAVPGKITIAGAGTTPPVGKGVFIIIRFKALQAGGLYLSFSGTQNNYFNEGTPSMSFDDAYVSITGLSSISVYPDNQVITKTETHQFNVSGGTGPYQWFVTNPAVASINASGILTGNQYGFTRVVAQDANGVRDTTKLIEIRAMRLSIPTDLSQLQGTDIDIPINTTDLSGLDIYSGNLNHSYYQNLLTPVGIVQTGTLLESFPAPAYNFDNPGKISIAFAGSAALTGSGTLIYVRFHISAQNSGGAWINFDNGLFNQDLLPTLSNGYLNITGLASLTVNSDNSYMIAGENMQFSVYGGGIPPFTWAVSDTTAASIDSSGFLSAHKSSILTITVKDSAGASASMHNFQIYDTGVIMPDTFICPVSPDFYYPILISGLPVGKSVLSIQGTIEYDTTYLDFVDFETTSTLTQGWTYSKNPNAKSIIFAASGTNGFNTGGQIANLRFTLKPNFVLGANAYVQLKSILLNEGDPLPFYLTYQGKIVATVPSYAPYIAGISEVVQGQSGVSYSILPITGATGYVWTLPPGAAIASGNNSNSIIVNFSESASSDYVRVYGTNECGSGYESPWFYVTVNTLPVNLCEARFNYLSEGNVNFTDQSIGSPTSWSWDFGDGSFSTEQNSSHSYTIDGGYDVTLTISNTSSNCIASVTNRIIAGNIPCRADFGYVIDTLNGIVNFTSNSINVTDFFWTFGDGNSSTLENPGHQYVRTGNYLVTLATRNSTINCMDVYTQFIQVGNTDCRAGFNYIVNHSSLFVNFKDKSQGQIEYYYWDFGDGTFSVDMNPDHNYNAADIYLTGQFVINLSNSCVDFIAEPVQVGEIDCSADFISYIDASNYTGYFSNRVLGASTAKLWSFGDGSFSTNDNPVHTFPGAGIYSAGLNTFDLNTGCMDYFTEMLIIGELGNDCSADFVYRVDPSSSVVIFSNISIGEIVESIWNFGDESPNSLETNPVHTFTNGGYYNVCLTVTNSQGIRNMGCKWVLIEGNTSNDCLANFMFTIDSINLGATFVDNSFGNINSYTWDFGDSSTDSVSNEQNPVHTFGQKGYYLVQLNVANTISGCESNEYKLLNIADNQVLKAAFGYEAQVPVKKLTGYPVDLVSASSGDGATVEWDFGDKQIKKGSFTVMDSTSRNVRHYYENPGKYEVCLRISDPVRNISDIYCSWVYTKNAIGVNQIDNPQMKLSIYPNPMVGYVNIEYTIDKSQDIEIVIYNQLGRKIETLVQTRQEAGNNLFRWEPKNLNTGVYQLRLVTEDGIITGQLVVCK